LWVIFALLEPDSESGYASTDPIESGSNPDPDPQLKSNLQKYFLEAVNLFEAVLDRDLHVFGQPDQSAQHLSATR
jgi:hypothetical protein